MLGLFTPLQLSLAVAWYRLPMSDLPLSLCSQIIRSVSYQLLTATVDNSWTSMLLWFINQLISLQQKSKSKPCYDRRSVDKSISISSTHLVFMARDCCGFVDVRNPLWRDDLSISYTRNCWWHSPAQSFSGLNPSVLLTIFHRLWFETPSTLKAMSPYLYPPWSRQPSYIPGHWVPFWLPPTTRRTKIRYSNAFPNYFL
jgi:hypothetical protein